MIYNNITYRTDASFETEIVEALPSTDLAKLNTIYFVKNNGADNTCSEYLCIEEGQTRRWELIGTTAVNLSDYVKKTDVKPLYVHNITLHYKDTTGVGDGECRASFVLINKESKSYSINTNTDNNVDWTPFLRLFRDIIAETNAPNDLTALLPYPGTPNSKNHLIPCSGVTYTPLTEGAAYSFCVNNHIGAKYFKYSDSKGEVKRLLIIYGYPTTAKALTSATGFQSALEISCGMVEANNDIDPIFTENDLTPFASSGHFTKQYLAITDLIHPLQVI